MDKTNPGGRAQELATALVAELQALRVAAPNLSELVAAESAATESLSFLEKAIACGFIREPYPNVTGQQPTHMITPPSPHVTEGGQDFIRPPYPNAKAAGQTSDFITPPYPNVTKPMDE